MKSRIIERAMKPENVARRDAIASRKGVRRVASLDVLRKRLWERGWERLGGGAFSEAFGKGAIVWKVCKKGRGMEDGGREYVADIVSGEVSGPYAPRCRMMLVDDLGDYAVLMERMSHEMDLEEDDDTRRSVSVSVRIGMGWSWLDDAARSKADAALVAFVRSLRSRYGDRYYFDLHGGNVMRRPNGTWAITDPISYYQSRLTMAA